MRFRGSTVRRSAGLAASALMAGLFVAPVGAQVDTAPGSDSSTNTPSAGPAPAAAPALSTDAFTPDLVAEQRASELPRAIEVPTYFEAPVAASDGLAQLDADSLAAVAAVNGLTVEGLNAAVDADTTLLLDEAGALFTPAPDFEVEPDAITFESTQTLRAAIAKMDPTTRARLAEQNGVSDQVLRGLAADPTAFVDTTGALFYVDTGEHDHDDEGHDDEGHDDELAELDDATFDDYATFEAFSLHSKPGASKVVFLDFNGYNLPAGTAWNGGNAWAAPAYDPSNDGVAFSTTERNRIISIWKRVAEDFAPFDVDVTTQDPGFAAIHRSNAADNNYGTRVVITDADGVGGGDCNCGGLAYVGNYDNIGADHSFRQPAWVFNTSTKGVAEAATHEAGHNLGLQHDGRTSPLEEYYSGHSPWAPIMGNSYSQPITQFSRGEYLNASQTQNDFAVMDANGLDLRFDDHGNDFGSGTDLGIGGVRRGIIERNGDGDMFEFTSCGGPVTITATPSPVSPNLDLSLFLYTDTNGFVTANGPQAARVSSDVASGLDASITRTLTYGDTYQVWVDQDFLPGLPANGYSTYGSRGFYELNIDQGTSCDMYALADQPTTPSYTVTNNRWANPAGPAPTVTRTGVGTYRVTFPAANILGGNVQVTSLNRGVICKPTNWGATNVFVRCSTVAGLIADAEFSVYFSHDDDDAYLWSYSSASSYTAITTWSNNPGGGPIDVTRTAVGDYTVTFTGYETVAGETQAQVTPYGNNSHNCTVDFWGSSSVGVDCFDISGNRVDTQFNVLLTKDASDAYVWANDSSAATYSPTASFAQNPTGGGITGERLSTGRYRMIFDGLEGGLGNVQVSAYSFDGVCTVDAWSNNTALVECINNAGALANAQYSVHFTPGAPLFCNGLIPTVFLEVGDTPTPGDDVIRGTAGDDVIDALDGDDYVCASLGNDRVNGGPGNDVIRLGQGNDIGIGGEGDDRIDGLDGADQIFGGNGNDLLTGDDGNDVISGEGGVDVIRGRQGDDRMFGGPQTDYINGGGGDDYIEGGDGNDGLRGNGGDDELYGNSGGDWIWGDADNDYIDGGNGFDDLRGGNGDDRIFGGNGSDQIRGAGGSDFMAGQGSPGDTCDGGADAVPDSVGSGCEVVTRVP